MLVDEDWYVRNDVVRALGKLDHLVLAKYADDIVPMLEDEDWYVRRHAVQALEKLEPVVLARFVGEFVSYLGLHPAPCTEVFDALEKVPLVALVPHRYALQSLGSAYQLRVKMLRGRVWLARWRQLLWCQRFLWWWWGRVWMPGSRQAIAAASEFGRMQGVSAEEEGEREVKRVRVV